jgi:hypothetical protein
MHTMGWLKLETRKTFRHWIRVCQYCLLWGGGASLGSATSHWSRIPLFCQSQELSLYLKKRAHETSYWYWGMRLDPIYFLFVVLPSIQTDWDFPVQLIYPCCWLFGVAIDWLFIVSHIIYWLTRCTIHVPFQYRSRHPHDRRRRRHTPKIQTCLRRQPLLVGNIAIHYHYGNLISPCTCTMPHLHHTMAPIL